MKRFRLLIALPALLLVGWPGASELAKVELAGERRHANGLQIPLPAGFLAETTDGGFVLRPVNYWDLRAPTEITLRFAAAARPEGDWPLRRSLGDDLLRYRIESSPGGSGGTMYILQAWKPLGSGHVRLEQSLQIEIWRPSFTLGWAVLEGARRP